jgi:hypothetical protein
MFKRTPQQEQWFKDGIYIKYNKKGHYITECSTAQGKLLRFKNRAQNKDMLENNNQIKGIRECSIKHFTFYYNNAYTVYKDAKYSIN